MNEKTIDLDIVGSSSFGRDPKIMASRTFNMILSDGWLVDYVGYVKDISTKANGAGRGNYTSVKGSFLICVVYNKVYVITIVNQVSSGLKTYNSRSVGELTSYFGDVFIEENNNGQIAICDQINLYIYSYSENYFTQAVLPDGFTPGYVTYQNGRFICPDSSSGSFALSDVGNGLNWFWSASSGPVLGAIQTKGDFCKAAVRIAGRGNLLFVMGNTITELWTDVGGAIFPYQRSTSVNIDYGCINAATIASLEQIIAWVGINEKSGPVILYSTGSDVKTVSTEGINYRLSQLNKPESCSAFFVKLNGHLIYQLTFYDASDNFSILYDFTTQKFFDVTDENMNFHIARRVAFFDNDYYFVSFNDNNIYRMSSELNTYDYGNIIKEIPRTRICSNIRLPDSSSFIVNNVSFCLEQGNDTNNTGNDPTYIPRIAMSASKNGGISFGSYISKDLNKVGNRINRIQYWGLGIANDLVVQFRFYGKGPWNASKGIVRIRK